MIVLRFRDAKSVMRSHKEEEPTTEMGAGGIEGSPDMSDGCNQCKVRLRGDVEGASTFGRQPKFSDDRRLHQIRVFKF
jgi:hypothetical protein